MQKPEYELTPLRAGIKQAEKNIAVFKEGIVKEEERIREYRGHIEKWERYNEWLLTSTKKTK